MDFYDWKFYVLIFLFISFLLMIFFRQTKYLAFIFLNTFIICGAILFFLGFYYSMLYKPNLFNISGYLNKSYYYDGDQICILNNYKCRFYYSTRHLNNDFHSKIVESLKIGGKYTFKIDKDEFNSERINSAHSMISIKSISSDNIRFDLNSSQGICYYAGGYFFLALSIFSLLTELWLIYDYFFKSET